MKNTIYIFLFYSVIFSGCKKEKEEDSPAPTNNNTSFINTPWMYSIKINDTTFTHQDGVNDFGGYTTRFGSLGSSPSDTGHMAYITGLSSSSINEFNLGIGVGTHYFLGTSIDSTSFVSFIHTGNYNYSPQMENGIRMNWIDAAGGFFATDQGSKDQSGSTFIITNVLSLVPQNGSNRIKIRATFNCKLYNNSGQSITLTNGVYVGEFAD